jgi:SnoaL-like domain
LLTTEYVFMTKDLILQFEAFYSDFAKADLSKLGQLYEQDVNFVDPVQAIRGLPALTAYFEDSREHLYFCNFEFDGRAIDGNRAFFQWQMAYAHPRLASGRPQRIRGCSSLMVEEKVVYHEDFYDLGAMLYDHIPVLGWATRRIKQNLAKG